MTEEPVNSNGRSRLTSFFLVPILSKPFLAFVSRDFMSFSLFTAGHVLYALRISYVIN